ncbi:MAG TPA: relaxase/mobilization nuclease domain-containing protein [Longimicrobium sp.]|uniref:relaxase/mobilization nuclease domain-containing protein n=1 Tax=Longimicrobium sp. TaxID=2029185 RepID=UPI002ED9540A
MIGAIGPLSRSFKVPIRYVEVGRDGQQNRVAWAETYNLPTRDLELAACFMGATANGSVSGTRTPVYFFSVSFDIDDPVDEAMMRRVARRTLRDMGLGEHEAVVVAHKDRSHPHLHFIVNRVHPERATLWRKWWDYPRLERSLRAQEVELGLRVVPGRHAPVPSLDRTRDGLTEDWQRGAQWIKPLPGPKRGDQEFLQDVTERAGEFLAQARSWAELESGLAHRGLALTVKGGGFRITDGKRQVKASEVGRGFSRYHLEKRLGGYPDYRARMAVADIGSVRRLDRIVVAPPPAFPKRIPEFGDAGYGINELFGAAPARGAEPPGIGVAPELAPTPVRGSARFLKQVRAQAGPVLEHANTWAELERAFSASHLKKRLDRQPEDAAPVIAAAAPPAPVALPAAPSLPRKAAAQTIAATAGHTDLDEQHQPIRGARTPQFGDAGHGLADLLNDPPQHQREQTGPALERAPALQPRQAESPAPTPAAADVGPVPAETSLGSTTTAPAMAEAAEPSQTAEPVREEVGPPPLSSHRAQSGVELLRQEPQRTRRKRGTPKSSEEQVDIWSQAPAPLDSGAPAAAVRDVAPDQPAPAVENPGIVANPPLSSIPPEAPREIEPVSAPEPPPMMEAITENAPAPASAERDDAARAELFARIERLRQKRSIGFMGKTRTGATTGLPDSTPQSQEVSRTVEGAGSEDAEKFLSLANRALEAEARSREVNDAVTEVIAAQQRLSGLDKAEQLAETTRSKFKAQLEEALRDPNAFLGWFDHLGEPRKREMLRLLEFERAAFAREFSAALVSGAAQATKQQDLLDALKAKAAELLAARNPEKRVFLHPVGEGQLRLVARDGEFYLDTERGCRAAFRNARDFFGLPKSATRDEVREAAKQHLASAEKREADAVFQKQLLGKTPELYELRGALRGLSVSDQEWVVKQRPALAKHIKHVAQAAVDLAEGPRRKGSGYDF